MAALDWISGSAIALLEFVVGQVGFEVDASWHAPVLQQHAATLYQTCEATVLRHSIAAVGGYGDMALLPQTDLHMTGQGDGEPVLLVHGSLTDEPEVADWRESCRFATT